MELTGPLNKHKNKFINATVIIIALIISNYIYRQQSIEISSLDNKKKAETKKDKEIGDISAMDQRIKSYQSLMVKRDAGIIITNISNFARESGINIISIRPGKEEIYQNYFKLPFDLVVNAKNYHAIGKFISSIESAQDVFFVVESLYLKTDQASNQLTASLRLSNLSLAD
jgi:Tfp pilus assembly protein PilO